MKKIFIFTLIVALLCSFFMISASAETVSDEEVVPSIEIEPSEDVTVPSQEPENSPSDEEKDFYDKLVGFVTDSEIWANIGTIAVSVIALILAIRGSLTKITEALGLLKEFIAGKATKEETETAIRSAIDDVKTNYNNQNETIKKQYEELEARNNRLEAVLSLVALQLVKSPNARVKIMELMADTKGISGDVTAVVESIEAEIQRADEAEKEPTPALDEIIRTIEESEQEAHHIELG